MTASILANGKIEMKQYDFDTTLILTKSDYENAVQTWLDEQAQLTYWDNMLSARSAVGIPLSGEESEEELAMHNDSIRLARLYLRAWATCYRILRQFENGDIEQPTVDELISIIEGE